MVKRKLKTKSLSAPHKKTKRNAQRCVPDVLYTQDGTTFYPCKTCCRAFSSKTDLAAHSEQCLTLTQAPSSPLSKESNSNKENFTGTTSDELNNNTSEKEVRGKKFEAITSPVTRSRLRAELKSEKSSPESKGKIAEERCVTNLNFDVETNVITTPSVGNNINKLSASVRRKVIEGINKMLDNTSIRVYEKNNFVVVELEGLDGTPSMQLTSRNLDSQRIELRSLQKNEVNPNALDIVELLERNFGAFKSSKKAAAPKNETTHPINEELSAEESELGEIIIDDEVLEGTIVLEDLDIHICKQCGVVFHTLEDLVNHDKYEHRSIKKCYPPAELEKFNALFKASEENKCPICQRVLGNKYAWPRHLQTHSILLNFECGICKKRFARDDHRKLHENRHVVGVTKSDDDEQ